MANIPSPPSQNEIEMRARRRAAMAILTCSSTKEIAGRLAAIDPLPAHSELRSPESGLVMLRGRIGGDGVPFNFGEATVSRSAIRLASGETGFGYVLGREREKSRLIALCDAMIQNDDFRDTVERNVIAPIEARLAVARETDARRVAATKVEFFTLVRGEG
jgi:alpha-D-ribose 1-methylphosphonate 5-triphosphate synthase subunit PhnG